MDRAIAYEAIDDGSSPSRDAKKMDNKSIQLGMSFSTASGRLKKNIMFSLVQRLNEDNCFKCGEKILTPEELSVEHKEPWLHNGVQLFWDLNNIAFSHLWCNKKHDVSAPARRIFLDEEIQCTRCKLFLPKENFHKNNKRRNGFKSNCKKCRSVYKDK